MTPVVLMDPTTNLPYSAADPVPVTIISGGGGGSNAAAGATGSPVPASASYTAFNSGGNLVGASAANPFPVTVISGGGGSSTFGAPFPASGVAIGFSSGGNLTGVSAAAPLPTNVTDGTSVAGVTAASTAATAAQPGAVVSLSPNSPLPAGTNSIGTVVLGAGTALAGKVGIDQTTPGTTNAVVITPAADIAPATQNITVVDSGSTTTAGQLGQNMITGSPTAGSAASFAIVAINSIRFQITGTWTGTLSLEGSLDGGTTWTPLSSHLTGTSFLSQSFTANAAGYSVCSGLSNVRVRATAAMTGTATVKIIETLNDGADIQANQVPVYTTVRTSTDKSGTVTSGGTAQNAIAANAQRKGWMLTNLSSDILYVRDDGTAASATTGVPVYPGQTVNDGGQASTSAISVLGATTGDVWSAKEYT